MIHRATIRPYFPGHALFFGPEISVRADFVNYMKSPEFGQINKLSLNVKQTDMAFGLL